MWAAASRDVSSRSPPPASERPLSIADSVVSTTAEEIRERYRLSTFQDEPTRRPIAHLRRDSVFSFNTLNTADESFSMISDFPRPPGQPMVMMPAIASSMGHGMPSSWRDSRPPDSATTPYADSFADTRSPGLVSPSVYSANTHLPAPSPLSRPTTAPNGLTVRTDAPPRAEIEILTGPSPTTSPGVRESMATTGSGSGSNARTSVAGSGGRTSLAPSPRHQSPSSPNSHYLVPSPSSLTYRTSPTHTQAYTYTTSRTSPAPTEKVPGFPVAPPSPNTAAFLRSPVAPPSTHTSHEELLDPGFIRGLMKGIEYGDGLSIETDTAEGPFGDRYASGDLEAPEPFFRRAPAASLPSSPRSSFSFSVRSGVGKAGWEEADVPDVPPLPAAYRPGPSSSQPPPPSPHSSAPPPSPQPPSPHSQTHSQTHSLHPDWSSRRRSVESRKTAVTGRSGGSGLTGITEQTGSEDTGVIQQATVVRTIRPAVYKSTEALRSPDTILSPRSDTRSPAWTRTSEAHARTTSADLDTRLGEMRNRRSQGMLGRSNEVEEGDELVYVSQDDIDRRESRYDADDIISQYVPDRTSRYEQGGPSRYDPRDRISRYDHRGSRYPDSYLDSPYVGSWADLPSPNEITPALRDSMVNDTASDVRLGQHGPLSPLSPVLPSPLSRVVPPFARDGYASPSTAPATPGHGSTSLTPGYESDPISPGPQSAPLPDDFAARRAKRVSTTSFVSSVFSKFSGNASTGHHAKGFAFTWKTQADAPPVPSNPYVGSMAQGGPSGKGSVAHTGESESTRASTIMRREGAMPLPALANRAERLGEMLELGKLPYRSKSTLGMPSPSPRVMDVPVGVDHEGNDVHPSTGGGYTDEKALKRNRSLRSVFTAVSDRSRRFIGGSGSLRSSIVDVPGQGNLRFNKLPEEHRRVQWQEGTGVPPPRPTRSRRVIPKKKMYILLGIAGVAIMAIIGVSVGLSQALGKRKPDAGGYTCAVTNQTGQLCDLDATCTCTSSLAGQCNPLAKSIADLIEPINRIFGPSPVFTPASVALSIWEIQGSPLPGANCANQADLIDVGPALSFTERGSAAANRTVFARSALLWTLVMSMDTNGTAKMQSFIQGLDYTRLDASVATPGEFLFGSAGYQFDFAQMTVSQPAVTWQIAAKPTPDQVALVGSDLRKALDKVYTFAAASSTQRSTALARYWDSVLQFPADQLAQFRSIVSASPILLPFDASEVRSLFSSINGSFPPPAACYPGLDKDELEAINTMEVQAFGLPRVASSPSALDPSCFQSRPVYGVLDIARLRTAFGPQSKVPKQAVQVAATSASRVSVRLGRDLAGIPFTSISTANRTGSDDPRTFGTINNMDHVILTYLQAFPSIQAAGALVDFVLGASDARAPPPSNTSALFNLTSGLGQLPVLEVAYFGTVGPDDLSLGVSDFATPDGELFFGSGAGDAFRSWAVARAGSVVWTDGPMAAQVVRQGVHDTTFEEVWKAGSTLLSNAQTTGTKTTRAEVQRIVDAFTTIGYMGL